MYKMYKESVTIWAWASSLMLKKYLQTLERFQKAGVTHIWIELRSFNFCSTRDFVLIISIIFTQKG